jgi:hypothetical protein
LFANELEADGTLEGHADDGPKELGGPEVALRIRVLMRV